MSSRISYMLAVLLLLVAAGLRLWQLTTLPVGLSNREFANVELMQNAIQSGDVRVFYEVDGVGQEGLYHSTLALSSLLFGTGTIGLRIISVFAALLTLALLYSLGLRLLGTIGALASVALMTVAMWPTLLARLVVVEALLPLIVTAMLLALARALPVYRHRRSETSSTLEFAALGTLLGVSLYVHPAGLMLILMAMAFIAYTVLMVRPLSLRRLSYIGFAILMMVIIAMPYLITTIRQPEYNAGSRIIGDYRSITTSLFDGLGALLLRGDSNILANIPGRPLFDVISGMLVLLGIVMSLLRWREPRLALLLIALLCLAPPALMAANHPNFLAMSVLLPVMALFFGYGLSSLLQEFKGRIHRTALVLAVVLLLFNLFWTVRDVLRWSQLENVQAAYNGYTGRIAHHLDLTADEIPTVLCFPGWDAPRRPALSISPAQRILVLMNRDTAALRYVDCRSGLVFPDGGQSFQVALPSPELAQNLPPDVVNWLALGVSAPDLPPGAVGQMAIPDELADALGLFTTTTPASLVTETDVSDRIPVLPPIRFGGNITWLGYQADPVATYRPGDSVPVITYWRVEGLVPRDLTLFTHILSDPVTIAANHDTISVNPAQLQSRDVFLQITRVVLPNNLLPDTYDISVGAYQASSDTRLPVLVGEGQVRGNRIFLYPINVVASQP